MISVKEIAKKLADKFMGVPLPKDFHPDAGISFNPSPLQLTTPIHWPIGTNLFHATQCAELFEQIVPDAFNELLEANAKLEARCKELESENVKLKTAFHVNMIRAFPKKSHVEVAEEISKIVSTPTTDEHLQKLFREWLGEPVAYMHKHENEVLEFNDVKSCDECIPLYAPKKVSNRSEALDELTAESQRLGMYDANKVIK